MRYLLILPAAMLLSGCATAQRYDTGAIQGRLEARAQEYQQAQEQRVHTVFNRIISHVPDPPNVALLIPNKPTVYAGTTYGKLVVTYGMVRFATTDDELAMVIGHEIAHHTQGHVRNQVVAGLGIALLPGVADAYAYGSGSAVSQLGAGLYNHYNQNQELEADRVGMQYAAASGYDPQAAATLWERAAIELPGQLTAAFFDSHPSSPERMLAAQHNAEILLARGSMPQPTSPERAVAASYSAVVPEPIPPRLFLLLLLFILSLLSLLLLLRLPHQENYTAGGLFLCMTL